MILSVKKTLWLVSGCMMLTSTVACDDGGSAVELQTESNRTQAAIVSSITEGDYVVRSVATNKCIDVSSSSTADGAKVQEWDCNSTTAQKFHISPTSMGYFKIINVNSGKGLDIKDVSTAQNAVVQQWTYGGGTNQQFRFVARGANQFSFHPRHTDMAIDLYWGRADNGTILVQYPYAGTANQLWTFDNVSGGGTAPPGTVPVVVTNNCPFNLNVVLAGVGDVSLEVDAGGNKIFRNLGPGGTYTYYPPGNYPSGRVSAYKSLPTPASPRELEKAEFTLGPDGSGVQNIYYNLTYVDHLGLPMKIAATGTGSDCQMVQCNKSSGAISSAIAGACPDGLRYTMGGDAVCLAPRSFCLDGEYASDPRRGTVCSRLDSEVARCASRYPGQCSPGTDKTPQVYACSGSFFAKSAKWCAAVTRGMLDNPDSTNVAQYYNTGRPYNLYAKWIHDQCGTVYSFAYDDYPMAAGQAGFFTCNGGRQLNVTFCPAG
jgi:hypothetical protein